MSGGKFISLVFLIAGIGLTEPAAATGYYHGYYHQPYGSYYRHHHYGYRHHYKPHLYRHGYGHYPYFRQRGYYCPPKAFYPYGYYKPLIPHGINAIVTPSFYFSF